MAEQEQKLFVVEVREVWVQPYRVMARGLIDAKLKVAEGEGDVLEAKLMHRMEISTWTGHPEEGDEA